jgi:hypothetical protein
LIAFELTDQRATLIAAGVAAAAALLAAGLSLASAILAAKTSRFTEREKWQREQRAPLYGHLLHLIRDLQRKIRQVSGTIFNIEAFAAKEKYEQLYSELEVARAAMAAVHLLRTSSTCLPLRP